MKNLRQTLAGIAAIAMLNLISGCYPQGPETVSDYDLVATQFDPNFSFVRAQTYYLVDSVVHITDSENNGSESELVRSMDAAILSEIVTQMDNAGYTRVTEIEGESPDLLITATGLAVTNVDVYYDYWWNYWGWWGGWNYWYPYYGFGWYPYGTAYYSSYTTGTLLIEMSQPKMPRSGSSFPLVWMGAMNGLLTNNPQNNESRAREGIQQAFRQSRYLYAR
jgi:hypothetical protein